MSGALAGLQVLDFGQYLAGPLVAQMLADQGAEVIRIDPPGGPRWRSEANAVLQRGKRSIVLDLKTATDLITARRLIATADIVVENSRPGVMRRLGLDPGSSLRQHPRLIWCSMPGFAADDARADVYAAEGVVGAAAALYASRDLDAAADPIFNTLPLASGFAAMIGANSIVAALIARQRGGLGQRIEVSLFDAAFELMRYYNDRVPGMTYPRIRLGATSTMALTHHYLCRDGRYVHLSWLEGRQLGAFARLLGLTDEWSARGLLDDARVRRDRAYSQTLRAALAPLFETRTASEWMRLCNPDADLAECLTTEEWLTANEQAEATRAVITLEDVEYGTTRQMGYPVSLSRTPPQTPGPRHALDADRAAILAELEGPLGGNGHVDAPTLLAERPMPRAALEGVHALDLTQLLAGPTACRILAEYGAEVVQITNPNARAGRDYHLSVDSGKRTILLDLKKPGGMDVFWSLIRNTDVVSTNFSADVAERLGVDEQQVRQRRPDVIYSRISAYGLEGPLHTYRGHDQVGQAVTGMEIRWGRESPTPLMQPHPVDDFGTGHLAAFGILLGLFHRLRSGEGQLVGASLAQTATFLQAPYMLAYSGKTWDEPGGQRCKGFGELDRLYRASDRWFFMTATDITRLASVEGLEQAFKTSDLESCFATLTACTWVDRLRAAGIGAHVLNTPDEAMRDEWAVSHGVSRQVEFPEAGPGTIVGPAPRLSATPMRLGDPSPPLGWHGPAIIQELGLAQRLDELVMDGALVVPPSGSSQLASRT